MSHVSPPRSLLIVAIFVIGVLLIPTTVWTSEQTLMAYADVADGGFSASKLDEARAFADKNQAAAVMTLHRGHVVAAWGAVDRPLKAHSVRKSLAGALYGQAVEAGEPSLSSTLADLGIDDVFSLTADERLATFGDVIAARSGVYHPAAYADSQQDNERPERGSHAPGTFWFYNNWDFNVAETIYEKVTGEDLYEAFDRQIARPLGMQDFDPHAQFRVLEPGSSRYPAHTFRISTRDLARFGQLYLQDGQWGGQQIVPASWVRDSLRIHSETGDHTGYGYLWWIYQAGSLGANYPVLNQMNVHLARGTGGQTIFLIPDADMVVVHRGDSDNGRSVSGLAIWQLVERLVAARDQAAVEVPALVPVTAQTLDSNLPAPPTPQYVELTADARQRFVGDYVIAPGAVARVFDHDGRLFMSIPRQGEAELFATGPSTFTIKVESGVTVDFESGADGDVTGVMVTLGPQKIHGVRK